MEGRKIFVRVEPESVISISLFLVYVIFGLLKIFGMSPIQSVVTQIVSMIGKDLFLVLGVIEVGLGIGVLISKTRLISAIFIILHLVGVSFVSLLFPNFLFSSETFLTIEGQFVVKNFVLVAAAYYVVWKRLSAKNSIK